MTNEELAAAVKMWRGKVSAKKAAELIGVPWRTLEYIEAGNGFRYPELLRIALRTIKVEGKK
jgi:DNA-binding XRE family transcriptional regulator